MKHDGMGSKEVRPLSVKDLDGGGKLSGEVALPRYQPTQNSRSKDGAPPAPPQTEREISGAPTGADAIRSFLVLFVGAIMFAGIFYMVKQKEDQIANERAAAEIEAENANSAYTNDPSGRHQKQIDLLNRRTGQ